MIIVVKSIILAPIEVFDNPLLVTLLAIATYSFYEHIKPFIKKSGLSYHYQNPTNKLDDGISEDVILPLPPASKEVGAG